MCPQDPKANTVEYQKTILLEVPPVSKWDLVVKEPRGGGGPALYLVSSVRREIRLGSRRRPQRKK